MKNLDLNWIHPFLDDLLARWLENAPNPNGLFHPDLDRQWRRKEGKTYTLVSQCRLIYNFARAYERSGDEAYATAARNGVRALGEYFRDTSIDPSQGTGWYWSCDPDGQVQDDTGDAYGHAFVILALATAARALQEDQYCDMALQTWQGMQHRFRDATGGLIWHIGRDGRAREEHRSQNPVMHTFEALLALAPLDATGTIRTATADIWRFIRARLFTDPVRLPEWYDAAWQPLASGQRSGVDIGHQYEWAYLLSEAHALALEEDLSHDDIIGSNLIETGRQLLQFGLDAGYEESGGVISTVTLDGRLKDNRIGWWQQCEAIRALARYVTRHDGQALAPHLERSLNFVREHFVDAEDGGWYTNPPGMGDEPNADKGNSYKLDYHVVNMCLELLDGEKSEI